MPDQTTDEMNPLSSLDVWEEDLLERYPDPESIAKGKTTGDYRNYESPGRDSVREFYRLNHTFQTYDFVQQKRAEFLSFNKKEMSVWEAFDFLNQLVDDAIEINSPAQHFRAPHPRKSQQIVNKS